jgi:Adenylosuccinate lyase (EC 4.3.2.2)
MICPIDFRYGREEMKEIFSREKRFELMLKVETSLAYAHYVVGNIDEKDYRNIEEGAKRVKIERADEIEKEIKHDVMAMVKAFSEACGESSGVGGGRGGGRYVHFGATSNDITDSATAIQLRLAISLLKQDLNDLIKKFAERAEENVDTLCIGRTHGQFALPLTFGYKLTVFGYEFIRHLRRIEAIEKRVCVGKMMGGIGTGASFGEKAMEIQKITMDRLGIGYEEGPTQIVGRDRYIEIISVIANIATSLEKLATEIRNLQRSEIGEVYEYFDAGKQVGSSTMAQKRNPITCENVCGLTRIIRGFLSPMHESAILWHERDLTNSSAERFILPHCFVLLDDALAKMSNVIEKMWVNRERMEENLKMGGDKIMAESVMLALTRKGMSRQEAHELIRK